jgi:hypothetical protein
MADSKSGSALGAENVAQLRKYLEALKAEGRPLPMRAGDLNLSAIALACGFDRQVLYKNPGAVALLDEARAPSAAGGEEDPKPVPRTDRRDRRIMSLEQENASLRAENSGLREKLRRLQQVEDIMVGTGRRVS